jgi:hypothetical protein
MTSWVPMALLFLEPPAFDTIKAQKSFFNAKINGQDHGLSLPISCYGILVIRENDFATRTRLYNLTIRDGNVLIYARAFNHLAHADSNQSFERRNSN